MWGPESYARQCEEAVNALEWYLGRGSCDEIEPFAEDFPKDNHVVAAIFTDASTYRRLYELERARRVLEAAGGERRGMIPERERREYREGLMRS